MKRLDDGKVSFVEFLRSIKFARQQASANPAGKSPAQFAHLQQQVRNHGCASPEESQLIRSAN